MNNNAIEQFINAVREPEYETNTTYSAVVSRVDGEGVAWVNLAGSEKETPTASTAADVKAGDVVTVQWRNNKLYIAGNYSNPSAGVVEVRHVVQVVGDVQQTADDAKETVLQTKKVVERVAKIAGNTNQYFWHTETGTDTGAHITEIPREDFIDDPTNGGGNLLARSNGIAVRDGLAELAVFGADGSQIGQTGKSHVIIDYHSLQMIDGDARPHVFFHISDLRDENNEYEYTEKFIGTGYTTRFSLSYSAARDKELSVTVSDSSGGEAYLDPSNTYWLRFETAPTDGATITVSYITNSYYAKAYTLGIRKNNSEIGPLSTCFGLYCVASESRSFAEGMNSEANGSGSHAEGYGTKANGNYSHSQGYKTIANRAYQVAIGEFNEIDNSGFSTSTRGKNAFIIGNGIDEDNRSNALTVDWHGNVEAAGEIHGTLAEPTISITASTGTLQSAIVYRQGNVVQLLVSFRKTSATASGENVFEGTINDTALRPKMITTGGTYYGSHALNATISTAGVITIKNADSRQLDAMTANGNISFTYLVD